MPISSNSSQARQPQPESQRTLGPFGSLEASSSTLRWVLPTTFACLSWALVGGGFSLHQQLVWLKVSDKDLPPGICPTAFLQDTLERRAWSPALGMMTSAQLEDFCVALLDDEELSAAAVVTVGLGNALRAGDPAAWSPRVGTINIACAVNARLSETARLEALSIITEAKSSALFDLGIKSRISGRPASGTGTDCQVIACPSYGCARHEFTLQDPAPEHGNAAIIADLDQLIYAGKHTRIGSLIGSVSYQAVAEGIGLWKQRYPNASLIH